MVTLHNLGGRALAFKLKGNAPGRFYVRPNSGLLPGGRSALISLSLQPELQPASPLPSSVLFVVLSVPADALSAPQSAAHPRELAQLVRARRLWARRSSARVARRL